MGERGAVLSPGQTPTTKAVLLRAIDLAGEASGPVSVEHVWSALRQCESGLVEGVLGKLARETGREGTP
jgi:hypothetical protein